MSGPDDRTLSLNEVETLAAKAARGAGADWGVAEDLGRAARWLAGRGLGWAPPLIALIGDAEGFCRLRPAFQAADRAAGSAAGDGWTAGPCDLVWAAPILSAAVHGRAVVLTLRGDGCAVRLGPDGRASADGPWPGVASESAQHLSLRTDADASPLAYPAEARTRRSIVTDPEWRALHDAAARTYVPASARSRAAGAGGGRVDDE